MFQKVMRPLALTALVLTVAGCGRLGEGTSSPSTTSSRTATPAGSSGTPASGAGTSAERPAKPALRVEAVADGLEHGWDIGFLPEGQVLVSQRPGRFALISGTAPGSARSEVEADTRDIFVQGEGGLMGMVMHPDFATTRQFTTCQTHQQGGNPVDVRLVTWRLSDDGRRAERVKNLLIGLPISTGRHSGCRPTIAADGALIVGTGDVAVGSNPEDLTSLGGKTLRLDLATGKPLPDNPFAASSNERQRYVYSYGHRNVQGVAIQPRTGRIYTAEHGPNVNDEVNLIRAGGNYGWDPARGGTVGGYDESVPMTDLERYPDAVSAIWESGERTEGICAAAFVTGSQWGSYDGALVITALKGAKLLFLNLNGEGVVSEVSIPEQIKDQYGRLRAARIGPDGALYVTTTNGENDQLLRISPQP